MSERLCLLCGNRWIADGLCHDDYDERRDPDVDKDAAGDRNYYDLQGNPDD